MTFQILNDNVVVIPALDEEKQQPGAPKFIILMTWMDAVRKHVFKYTSAYQELYPSSTIICISSEYPDFIYRSRNVQKANLGVVVSILTNEGETDKSAEDSILVHLFSNGGGLSLVNLCDVYRQAIGQTLPIQALILDSCPGRASLGRGSAALLENLPKAWYASIPLTAVLYPLFFVFWLYTRLQPADILETVRNELNDVHLVTKSAQRLYIYTAQDKIVDSADVEEHIVVSRQLGYDVYSLCFENGAHVGHLKYNGTPYWEGVSRLWETSARL